MTDEAKRKRKAEPVHDVEIVRLAEAAAREGWDWDALIAHAQRGKERDEQPVEIVERINAFPLDAALALYKAIERRYGVATVTPDDFRQKGVPLIAVQTGPRNTDCVLVPWGKFALPNSTGSVEMSAAVEDGQQMLRVKAVTRRKHEARVRSVIQDARAIVERESLYRGKALRLVFRDSFMEGEFADVRFLDLSGVSRADLIFARDVQYAIDNFVLTPILYPEACERDGIPAKRGVVLAGEYGVGKTMLAHVVAQVATERGLTFTYLEDIEKLPQALAFGRQYGGVLFGEDVDRVAAERDDRLNDILNTLDGIESKGQRVLTILTTNNVEKLHAALLRRGRTDVLLFLPPPDAEAAERLLRQYGRGRVPPDADLRAVAARLAGQIPATIREVAERAKLAAITRTGGLAGQALTAEDMANAAYSVLQERDGLAAKPPELSEHERACKLLGEALGQALGTALAVASPFRALAPAAGDNGRVPEPLPPLLTAQAGSAGE